MIKSATGCIWETWHDALRSISLTDERDGSKTSGDTIRKHMGWGETRKHLTKAGGRGRKKHPNTIMNRVQITSWTTPHGNRVIIPSSSFYFTFFPFVCVHFFFPLKKAKYGGARQEAKTIWETSGIALLQAIQEHKLSRYLLLRLQIRGGETAESNVWCTSSISAYSLHPTPLFHGL